MGSTSKTPKNLDRTLENKALRSKPQRFNEREFRPYVISIGQIALAWNDLNESLTRLFSVICPFEFENHAVPVWNVFKTDRQKRDLIAAVLEWQPELEQRYPRFKKDIRWILDRTTVLEDARNDAV